jgi:hypothetical protein
VRVTAASGAASGHAGFVWAASVDATRGAVWVVYYEGTGTVVA